MDQAVEHEGGKPAFYMQDLTFTHLVVDRVQVPLSRQPQDSYTIYYAGTSEFFQLILHMLAEMGRKSPSLHTNSAHVHELPSPYLIKAEIRF